MNGVIEKEKMNFRIPCSHCPVVLCRYLYTVSANTCHSLLNLPLFGLQPLLVDWNCPGQRCCDLHFSIFLPHLSWLPHSVQLEIVSRASAWRAKALNLVPLRLAFMSLSSEALSHSSVPATLPVQRRSLPGAADSQVHKATLTSALGTGPPAGLWGVQGLLTGSSLSTPPQAALPSLVLFSSSMSQFWRI